MDLKFRGCWNVLLEFHGIRRKSAFKYGLISCQTGEREKNNNRPTREPAHAIINHVLALADR